MLNSSRPNQRGPYTPPIPPIGVPSLSWFCINQIYNSPEQLHILPFRLNFRNELNHVDLNNPHPRLWLTLVQLYDNLPALLNAYTIPLNDEHLSLFQEIPATPLFSLLTVLELPHCPTLNDSTISRLKDLHSLVAFDASFTAISADGLKSLTNTLTFNDDHHAPRRYRGPWPLRILRLRGCKRFTNEGYASLLKFPLLSIVDLRDTGCLRKPHPKGFDPADSERFYSPTSIRDSLGHLLQVQPELHSSPNPYTLHITELDHPLAPTTPSIPIENSVITFSYGSSKPQINSSVRLEARADVERHEQNKEAWYERNEGKLDSAFGGPPRPIKRPRTVESNPNLRPPRPPRPIKMSPPAFKNAFAKSHKPLRPPQSHASAIAPSAHALTFSISPNPFAQDAARASPSTRPLLPKIAPQSRASAVASNPFAQDASAPAPLPKLQLRGAFLMLYRHPPPYSALDVALHDLKQEKERKKDRMKANNQMRNAVFADVQRTASGSAAEKLSAPALLQRQLQRRVDSLAVQRHQMQNEFATPAPKLVRPTSKNPFRRHSIDPAIEGGPSPSTSEANKLPTSRETRTLTDPKKPLKPVSAIPPPVFTADLLEESMEAVRKESIVPEPALKRSNSLPKSGGKHKTKSRPSDPPPPPPKSGFDWGKWAKTS